MTTRIICAKSRVAPKKTTATIPRLELCAAQLLTNLYQMTKQNVSREIQKTIFWCDSTVTLHWINTEISKLLPFVANRVREIQTHTTTNMWRYIRSADNPADHISRGLMPDKFKDSILWREGPSWLKLEEKDWPEENIFFPSTIPESRKIQCLLIAKVSNELFEKFSSLKKLKRIIAYCLRFRKSNIFKGPITAKELNLSLETIIKTLQKNCFPNEIRDLKNLKAIDAQSKLRNLNPFLDERGLIRVRGRLENANIPYSQKYPIIIPFEEFNTFDIEVEAILNSRPLTPISSNPEDLTALTPGHFLVGDCLTGLPDPDYTSTSFNRLSSWKSIQKLKREFWNRWHKEYLNQLILGNKWKQGDPAIREGDVVVLKEQNPPPRQWSLARVIQTYPGKDGVVRVVKIKTSRGEYDRNVRDLAILVSETKET